MSWFALHLIIVWVGSKLEELLHFAVLKMVHYSRAHSLRMQTMYNVLHYQY